MIFLGSAGCWPAGLGSLPRPRGGVTFELRLKMLPAGLPATTGWQPGLPRSPALPKRLRHHSAHGKTIICVLQIVLPQMLDSNAARCSRRSAVSHRKPMKRLIFFSSLIIILLWTAVLPTNAQVNVTQEHNNLSRDGLYIDSAFTPSNAANLTRDMTFDGTISGHVYAQPLYIEGGPNGAMVIAVTESNNVYALHADTGTVIWSRTDIGTPAPTGACPGNISPVGITGTPVVDLPSRSLFFAAVINGNPVKHFIFSLNVDTGTTNWSVNVDDAVTNFSSAVQEERGGLALVNGRV